MQTPTLLVLLAVLLLIAILLIRAARYGIEEEATEGSDPILIDQGRVAERLAGALRLATVSFEDRASIAKEDFLALHSYLSETFPKTHAILQKETVGELGLLFTWRGTEKHLAPLLLLAHQDVVPVAGGTEQDWTYPPFSGRVAEGHIWGRGALDDKSSLMAILEAVEGLLHEGLEPKRTICLAFGHDEEIGGSEGAARIARLLESRKVRFEFVLDEGGFITEGILPGVACPVALVGIAEKGYASLELKVKGKGGHSSIPQRPTTIGTLSKSLMKIEENPIPADLSLASLLFDRIGQRMPLAGKLILANLWLFKPLAVRALGLSPETNAIIRTTAAPTMLSGSEKENVLPTVATATVNFRIMPGESVAGTERKIRKTIADPRVKIHTREVRSEPSPVSDIRSAGYELVRKSIHQASEEDLAVAPFLVVGATDSRHYRNLSDNIFRFTPIRMRTEDLQRMHGTDERIAIEDYARMVRFYTRLILNSQEP